MGSGSRAARPDGQHARPPDESQDLPPPGQSRVIDPGGSVLAQQAEGEGIVVAAAVMDPRRKRYDPQPSFGRWLQPARALVRKAIIPLHTATAGAFYPLSPERRRQTLACLARTAEATSGRAAALITGEMLRPAV
jgi:hypothetical protein